MISSPYQYVSLFADIKGNETGDIPVITMEGVSGKCERKLVASYLNEIFFIRVQA